MFSREEGRRMGTKEEADDASTEDLSNDEEVPERFKIEFGRVLHDHE